MTTLSPLAAALPHVRPGDAARQLLLFGIRRLGANGLADAAVANAFVTAFGKDFRRPLMLLRALMADLSAASANPIQIAPGCCHRMTGAEGTLLTVLSATRTHPERAALLLADLLGVRHAGGLTATATALARSFDDLGLPIA